MQDTIKQSPIIAYRLPDHVKKEERDALNRRMKEIAKARGLNYFELFSFWVANDHLLESGNVEQTIKPDMTQIILERLDNLEKSLTNRQLALPFTDDIKHTVEQNIKQEGDKRPSEEKIKPLVKHDVKQGEDDTNSNPTKEELIARVKGLHAQGKNSEEIAKILTDEKIPTLKGKSVWSSRTIRDWLKGER